MSGLVVGLDANVLVPIIACDVLLTAFDHGLYEPVVSTTVLDEVERTLIDGFPHLPSEAIRSRVVAMRSVLDDQLVEAETRGVPVEINPKDRHVVGAALQGEATLVVTNDGRLRNEIVASGLALRGVDLDTFMTTLWESAPADVVSVADSLIRKRRRPPVTKSEMLASIESHMPNLVERLTR